MYPKWPTAAILSKIQKKIKILYWSKMARNAIESEFRTSKMADSSHFVKKISKKLKLSIDLKWPEKCNRKWISDIQNGRKRPFCKKNPKKIKLRIDLKCDQKLISDIQNERRWPFCKTFFKKITLIWNGQISDRKWFSDNFWSHFWPF